MRDRVKRGVRRMLRRLRRIERREAGEFRRWIENTENLLHLSILVFVPILLGVVTLVSSMTEALPFLLFPPLASGTYTLFARPESEFASPRRFVFGLTLGAFCGYLAYRVAAVWFSVAAGVHPASVSLGIALTAAATWLLDVEEPSAFSSALLIHVVDVGTASNLAVRITPTHVVTISPRSAYVVSVFLSTTMVATVFVVWREEFYEERARYLYGTTQGDDHVLVPMRGDGASRTALFGARLAAAHEAGKVVLLKVLEDVDLKGAPDGAISARGAIGHEDVPDEAAARVEEAASELNDCASRIRTQIGVPCEVVVATGKPGQTAIDTARRTNCDLVVTPYEEDRGSLSPFVRSIFSGPMDAVAFRSTGDNRRWKRVLTAVARPGDSAHAMVDFATRLAGRAGVVSVCTCIEREVERREAERRLADIVEAFDGPIETRVARADVADFIEANADAYDLVVLGSSGDRSTASRFISPPTFERLREVDCDVAVVDRGWE